MKNLAGYAVLLAAVVVQLAFAGDMTADQAMQKMMNCSACKPMMDYPQLGPNIRYDIHETPNGFVATFMLADEKLMPAMRECEAKCEVTRAAAMKMSDKEAQEHLCPFCTGLRDLMSRGDVTLDHFETSTGYVTVVTSNTDDGVKATHTYAQMARETSALLAEASAKMEKVTQ